VKSTAHRVIDNTLWLLLQRLGGRFVSFLLMIYLARHLGSMNFGKFTFANSFIYIFLILADLGITTLVVRDVASNRDGKSQYVGNTAILKVILSVVTFIVILVASNIMQVPDDTKVVVCLISAYLILENMGGFFGAVFQAYEKMSYIAIIEITQKLFLFFLCFIFLSQGHGLVAVSFAYLFSGIFFCLINMIFVSLHFFKPIYRIDLKFWKEILKESFPLAIAATITMIYYNIDIIMLGKMKGEEIAGWYGVSYNLFLAVAVLSGAFLSATFPVMSRFFKESKDMLKKAYEKSFKVIVGVGLPFSVGGSLFSERFITFLFGSQYQHSIPIFRIFASIIIFSYLNNLIGYFLISINRQALVAKILAVTVTVNVLLNFILIPRYSYTGAACATVVSEILFFIISFVFLPADFRYFPGWAIIKSVLACSLMGITIILLNFRNLNLALVVLAAIAVYSIFLWITQYFDKDDRMVIKNILRG